MASAAPRRNAAALAAALMLAGCASTVVNDNFNAAQRLTKERLGSEVRWLTTEEAQRDAQTQVDGLLSRPLEADDAVRIALAYGPTVQATLFEAASKSAGITQSARLPNPVFSFERLTGSAPGVREIEIGRALAFSLYDVLLLPSRLRLADYQQQQTRLRLAGDIVGAALEARESWIRAVAAGQMVLYYRQVKAAADASAELARRMQATGNFSRVQRAREQAFSAEAVTQLARAQRNAASAREALVRTLGLSAEQAERLRLPDRLPDLPAQARSEEMVLQAALDQRLDIRFARANLEFTAEQLGLTRVTSVVNSLQLSGVSHSEPPDPTRKGFEVSVPLPLFDFGDAARVGAEATYRAALQRTAQLVAEASSQLREAYITYRSADDIARHYRDEIVPLRKAISDENLLRYNGMLIGVFELLADAREQITSVVQSIEAQRDFWLADAGLQAALIGRPIGEPATSAASVGPVRSGRTD